MVEALDKEKQHQNVVIISESETYDGITQYSLNLQKAIESLGFPSHYYQFVIPGKEDKYVNSYFTRNGIRPLGISSLAINVLTKRNISAFNDEREGIFHLMDPFLLPLADNKRIVISFIHDLYRYEEEPFLSPYSLLLRNRLRYISNVSAIAAGSEFTRLRVIERLNADASSVFTVYNSIDCNFFSPGGKVRQTNELSSENYTILHVGADRPNKNLDFLIRLLAKLPVNYNLVRVGRNTKRTLRLISKLGLNARISVLQNTDEYTLRELYRTSNLLVFPSTYEGFGRPVAEAMSCGLPVLVSGHGALPEIVDNKKMVVPAFDIAEWSDRIQAICVGNSRTIDTDVIRRARIFSISNQAEQLKKMYKKMDII